MRGIEERDVTKEEKAVIRAAMNLYSAKYFRQSFIIGAYKKRSEQFDRACARLAKRRNP